MDQDQLLEMFNAYGEVQSARIITDRETGRSKGFGFVDMANDEEAEKAIEGMNGNEIDGRKMVVNQARPREERPRREGGFNRGGRGGGFNRGGGGGYNRDRY
jgi:RNA recognition motif-containing protein